MLNDPSEPREKSVPLTVTGEGVSGTEARRISKELFSQPSLGTQGL